MCSTTVVNKRNSSYTVYIGRGSKWGNPFTHLPLAGTLAKYHVNSREEAISSYEHYILHGDGRHLLNDLHELRGQTLGCYCKPLSCHGDILAKLADNQ